MSTTQSSSDSSSSATSSESRYLTSMKAGRDTTVVEEGVTADASLYLPLLTSDKEQGFDKGATIIVAADKLAKSITKELGKADLKTTATDAVSTESEIIIGSIEDVAAFLDTEVSRAMNIARVVLQSVSADDTDALKNLLSAACKRGRRPQLVLLSEKQDSAILDVTKNFFQESASHVQHLYKEVAADLLSKPNALCDFIEAEGYPTTLIFCNQPSDTDLLEVVLRKRGIAAQKLIGNVPPHRAGQAINQIQNGELTALVVTDISARAIDIEQFELIINHAIHSDPEVYVHRTETSHSGGKLKKVINLVGPLDRANFHYLKKVVETTFEPAPALNTDALQNAKLTMIKQKVAKVEKFDEVVTSLVASILKDADKERIISYLVNNALTAPQPAAQSSSSSYDSDDDRGEYRDRDRGGDRGDRGGDRQRGGRRGGGRDFRGGNSRYDNNYDEGGRGGDRPDSRNFSDEGDDSDSQPRRRERVKPPTEKISRIYFEGGDLQGLSNDSITKAIDGAEAIKRVSVRGNYGFVDVVEEATEKTVEALQAIKLKGKEKLTVKAERALSLSTPKPYVAGEDDQAPQDAPESISEGDEGLGEQQPV